MFPWSGIHRWRMDSETLMLPNACVPSSGGVLMYQSHTKYIVATIFPTMMACSNNERGYTALVSRVPSIQICIENGRTQLGWNSSMENGFRAPGSDFVYPCLFFNL